MPPIVEVERRGRVAVITFNRPDSLNAIGTQQDCMDLVAAIDALTDDRSISAAALTGAGRAFSAGGNLKSMKERNGIGPLKKPASTRHNYRRGVRRDLLDEATGELQSS